MPGSQTLEGLDKWTGILTWWRVATVKLLEVWIIIGFNLSHSSAWRLIIDGLEIWIKYLFS